MTTEEPLEQKNMEKYERELMPEEMKRLKHKT